MSRLDEIRKRRAEREAAAAQPQTEVKVTVVPDEEEDEETVVYQDDTPVEEAPKSAPRRRRTKKEMEAAKAAELPPPPSVVSVDEDEEECGDDCDCDVCSRERSRVAKEKHDNLVKQRAAAIQKKEDDLFAGKNSAEPIERNVPTAKSSKSDGDVHIVHVGGSAIRLVKRNWTEEIDLDEISKIDYSNLFGEVVTISALLNRVGNLKAEMEEQVALEKLDGEVFDSQKRSEHTKRITSSGTKAPTIQGLEDILLEDPEVLAKRKKYIQTKKNLGLIESLYWSVKSKDDKLSKLLKAVTPEEFEMNIFDSAINGFIIKKNKHVL